MKINIMKLIKRFLRKNGSTISIIFIASLVIMFSQKINIEFPLENLFVNDKTQGLLYLIVITLPIAMLVTLLKYKSGWEKPIRKMNIVLLYFIFVLGLSYYFEDKIEDIEIQLRIVIILIFLLLLALEYEKESKNESNLEIELDIPVNTKEKLFESRKNALERIEKIYNIETEESFAIGISGLWGTGKTSLVNVLKSDFEDDNEKIVIYSSVMDVNKWSELIDFYYLELKNKLKERRVYTGLDDGLKKYFSVIKKISGENKLFQSVFDLSGNTSFSVGKEELEEQIRKSGYKIYFIVDDIERLEKDDVRKVLFFLRGILNLKNTKMFLIADRSILEGCFEQKNFIDKFVNEWIEVKEVETREIFDYYMKLHSNDSDGSFSDENIKSYLIKNEKESSEFQNINKFCSEYEDIFKNVRINSIEYYEDIFKEMEQKKENLSKKTGINKEDISKIESVIEQKNNIRFVKKYLKELMNVFLLLKMMKINKSYFDSSRNNIDIARELSKISFEKRVLSFMNRAHYFIYLDTGNEYAKLESSLKGEQKKIYDALIIFNTFEEIKTVENLKNKLKDANKNKIKILSEYLDIEKGKILEYWTKEICLGVENGVEYFDYIDSKDDKSIKALINILMKVIELPEYEYQNANNVVSKIYKLIKENQFVCSKIENRDLLKVVLKLIDEYYSPAIVLFYRKMEKNEKLNIEVASDNLYIIEEDVKESVVSNIHEVTNNIVKKIDSIDKIIEYLESIITGDFDISDLENSGFRVNDTRKNLKELLTRMKMVKEIMDKSGETTQNTIRQV